MPDVVTCLALSDNGRWLITGSRDTTVISWEINYFQGVPAVMKRDIFHGHDDEVTSVAVNTEYDMVLTGSLDGTCIIHSLRSGTYARTLRLSPGDGPSMVKQVAISNQGSLVVASVKGEEHELHLFGINGKKLKKIVLKKAPLNAFVISSDGKYIIIAAHDIIGILLLHSLKGVGEINVGQSVTVNCLAVPAKGNYILAGLSDGKLLVVTEKTS